MPVHFAEAPKASVEALEAALPRIAARASLAAQAPRIGAAASRMLGAASTADAGQAVISAPVHVLGLDHIVAGKKLSAAPIKVWTHLLPDGDKAPDVLADVDALTNKFSAITEGQQVSSLGRQLRSVETEGRTSEKDYDVAVIRIPALHLSAVWLKGRNGAADMIVPNESPSSPLTAGRHSSFAEFMSALKPLAETQLRQTDPEKGG